MLLKKACDLSNPFKMKHKETIHRSIVINLRFRRRDHFTGNEPVVCGNVTRVSTKWHGACNIFSERKIMNRNNDVLERGGNGSVAPVCLPVGREFKSTRVWLVDDNARFRSLLADLVETETGFECERQFSSPPEVLEALSRETAPDIILLDIEMGEHNGLNAIAPIKAVAPETHVLMLTTFSGPGSRERAFREGASDFMLKSWSMPEIATHMRQAMEFGPVAGLITAFLSGGGSREETATPKAVELTVRTSRAEGWLANLRGFLKFSTS
jgi:DNA-binding NarL/FixJ family response regulator